MKDMASPEMGGILPNCLHYNVVCGYYVPYRGMWILCGVPGYVDTMCHTGVCGYYVPYWGMWILCAILGYVDTMCHTGVCG